MWSAAMPRAGFPLLVEHLYAAPYALLRVVTDGAGVGHNEVCLINAFCALIAGLSQDCEYDFGVIDVHLTPVCLYVYLFHRAQRYEISAFLPMVPLIVLP